MIVVHIEHFLNQEGKKYFPIWVDEVAQKLREYEGFISISILDSVSDPDQCHLLLKFENITLLRKWADSQDHNNLIDKLKPYHNRKQSSTIFEQSDVFMK